LFALGKKKRAHSDHFGAPLAAAAGVLVAVGLVVLMVVEARPAGAAFPGQNGKIAYVGYDGHDYEIYTISAQGKNGFQVTNNDTNDFNPSYSPNGKEIAYEVFEGYDSDSEIYTINVREGSSFQVTNNDTRDTEPLWGNRR
jgi:hypothetical protein